MGCGRARQSGGHGQERGNTPILDGRGLSIRASRPAAEGVRSQPQSGVGCASLLDQLVFSLLKKHRLKELKISVDRADHAITNSNLGARKRRE